MNPARSSEDIEDVVNRYSDMVYRIAVSNTMSKHDADDIFQETFLRYMQSDKEYESEEHRKAWLIRVTVNLCRSFHSQMNKHSAASLEDYENELFAPEETEEKGIFERVHSLPEKLKTVILLFYYEEMSVREIADTLGISEANVKMRLNRGRNKLKLELEEEVDHK